MKRIKGSTQLTLFITLLITASILLLYMLLVSEINADMARKGLDYTYNFFNWSVAAMLIVSAFLAFLVSSLIIDKIMNPIRLMISKVNEVGNMNFSKPLVISSGDEDLREYATAFNNMSQKVGGYIERQKRFISDASHELVTPVTIINGHADLLLRRGKEHPELLADGLEIIKSEALRMDELIGSLLILARSDSGKQNYSFEQVMISTLILESVEEAKIIAPDFTFDINLDREIKAKCDDYAIRRVLRIILSNAIKYSADGKHVTVTAYESHGLINISIKDNGIGIPQEHLPRIFDRFYRVDDSRSKKTGSSGLGLAIAKEIINAHNGEIQVSSEAGAWTEFRVILAV